MKPRKTILTLAAVTALFSAGGCDLNSNVAVYGPPPDGYQTTRQTITQTYPHTVTQTAPDLDPAENIAQGVYGPPVDLDESSDADTFEPENNIAETVYGPPVSFEESTDTAETSETADTADISYTDEEE